MEYIKKSILDHAYDYAEYRSLIEREYDKGLATGGHDSASMLNYTKLNMARMRRLDKTIRLGEDIIGKLRDIDRKFTWLVLTEGWCGDAAQVIPVLAALADQSPHIDLKFILRDENLDIIDAFLTNGGRSIPKVIILDAANNEVIGSWGPRPDVVQQMMLQNKKELADITDPDERDLRYQEYVTEAQLWYAKDKTKSIQREFLEAFTSALQLT